MKLSRLPRPTRWLALRYRVGLTIIGHRGSRALRLRLLRLEREALREEIAFLEDDWTDWLAELRASEEGMPQTWADDAPDRKERQ